MKLTPFLLSFQVLIIGPSDTLYEGGFFKCHLVFPQEYPLRPPKLTVITDIWHPNIERNGDVCISILHEPGKNWTQLSNPTTCHGINYVKQNATNNVTPVFSSVFDALSDGALCFSLCWHKKKLSVGLCLAIEISHPINSRVSRCNTVSKTEHSIWKSITNWPEKLC